MSSREYIWGVQLSKETTTVTWDPEEDDDEDDEDASAIQHFLFLKQAVLGVKAKPGERNVVEIKAEDFDGKLINQPLFSLREGLNESSVLDIGAQPPVTLTLVSGNGPVSITGQHALELRDDDDFGIDDLDDEDDEAVESPIKPQKALVNGTKRSSAGGGPNAKKPKLDKEAGKKTKDEKKEDKKTPAKDNKKPAKDDDDDDDDDEEDDDDFEMDADDDDDEDDSEEEGEDDEDDDEEDDDDEKESDESPEKPKPTPKQQKETKKDGKKDKEEKKPMSFDDIKKALQKSPAKPKKQGKFQNFVRSQYNVTDEKTVGKLWEWYKGTQLKN